MKIGRRIAMQAYLYPEQYSALKNLSKTTGTPMQEYLRSGLDVMIEKHQKTLANEK